MTGADAETTTPRKRFRWRTKDYSPEEIAEARKAWRDAMPWEHPMSRGDKGLVFATLAVVVLMTATMPIRPFLLASHPTLLAAVTGSLSATGAGAAFARIGEGSLGLVVAAGTFGMVKFDWLFWLAGRRWGEKIITMWAPGDTAQRFVAWIRNAPRWVTALAVVAASLPGVPAPAVFALAGLGRIRLVPFLVLDAVGAALMTGLVAGLGYGIGQHAVDAVLLVDKYALWITLSLIAYVTVKAARKGRREQKAQEAQQATPSSTG